MVQKNQGDGEACVRGMRGLKQLIVFNSSNEHNDHKDGTQQRTQVQGNGAPGLGNDEGSGAMTQATPFSVFQKRLSLFPAFFPRLVKLSLADCGIGLDGVTALVDGMKQQGGWLSLEVLELRHNLLCSQVRPNDRVLECHTIHMMLLAEHLQSRRVVDISGTSLACRLSRC